MSGIEAGERIGVLGLARSGVAAARLALSRGASVYASDVSTSDATMQAAERLAALGADVETGGHDIGKLVACDRIVLSPGIPPSAAVLRAPELANVPIVPELEFAAHEFDGPLVAVTGTNGKTTVTSLIAHALRASELTAEAGGNIGIALSELIVEGNHPQVIVAEVSSFQLGRTHVFAPTVGVLTNLAPDHLDWYKTVDDYYADKARLFANATSASLWVLNAEDDAVLALIGEAPGARYYFRGSGPLQAGERGGYLDADGWLVLRLDTRDERLLPASELKILGPHNIANCLAAAIAARLVGADPNGIATGLRTFTPMQHRLEPVAEVAGVLWVNDSKATNIASASVAIRSLDRPTVLLLGGRHKGEAYEDLIDVMRDRVKAIVAYGEAADRIEEALGRAVRVEVVRGSFADVLGRASAIARPGDAVLLSPACSSYDMFRDYEDRGTQFRQLVQERAR